MKLFIKRIKQGLPEGSSFKIKVIIDWYLYGIPEEYKIRMSNKYPNYKTPKPCGSNTVNIHPCDFGGYYSCRNCELG